MKNLCCPITGVYPPRFIPCLIAGFVFVFGLSFVLHHQLLMSTYEQTPQLWRTPEDKQAHSAFMFLTQFLTVFFTALLYTRNHEGKGVAEGLRFGAMIGLLLGTLMAAPYAWLPISMTLAKAWFAGGLIQGLGLGVIYSVLYSKGKKSCCGNGSCGAGECKCNKGKCGGGKTEEKKSGECSTGSCG